MGSMSRQPPDPRPDRPSGRPGRPGASGSGGPDQSWRWAVIVLLGLVVAALVIPPFFSHSPSQQLSYTQYINDVDGSQVSTATIDNNSGHISGKLTNGSDYTVNGPQPAIQSDQ